jgi:hypothetical protein
MKARKRIGHDEFVDALREALGLDPLPERRARRANDAGAIPVHQESA